MSDETPPPSSPSLGTPRSWSVELAALFAGGTGLPPLAGGGFLLALGHRGVGPRLFACGLLCVAAGGLWGWLLGPWLRSVVGPIRRSPLQWVPLGILPGAGIGAVLAAPVTWALAGSAFSLGHLMLNGSTVMLAAAVLFGTAWAPYVALRLRGASGWAVVAIAIALSPIAVVAASSSVRTVWLTMGEPWPD
ncbi:MAG: hypothetical protein R3F61_33685 [Myxococcota bacterium]